MSTKVISNDQARARWREVLDTAVTGSHIIIERYGKPVVVVIPYQDYIQSRVVKERTVQAELWQLHTRELQHLEKEFANYEQIVSL
ncbi:MAG TPA: type II toxin-antitoxin system Phd/YefM family antitoxin [Anaerolineae bacterium]|nr:type II toxin-antitoxin system Phd/YefM family antitoxin [Anaerolineae bacterium]